MDIHGAEMRGAQQQHAPEPQGEHAAGGMVTDDDMTQATDDHEDEQMGNATRDDGQTLHGSRPAQADPSASRPAIRT